MWKAALKSLVSAMAGGAAVAGVSHLPAVLSIDPSIAGPLTAAAVAVVTHWLPKPDSESK